MMTKRILAVALLITIVAITRDRPKPIGGKWAMGKHGTLYRVGAHPYWSRQVVAEGTVEHQFYPPDCMVYRATESFQGALGSR